MITEFFNRTRRAQVALFLSGTGTNAEKLLEFRQERKDCEFDVVLMVTDRPEESRARELAERFGLPLAALDIKKFYRERGLATTSLATPQGRQVREEWTNELRKLISGYSIDFGVLAGFVPLTNLTGDFPCLNVHPADLTVTDENGLRKFVGLHNIPVEKAILAGEEKLRSSVILALPYHDSGATDMDNGPLIGMSAQIPVDWNGETLAHLREVASLRPAKRPKGGHMDALTDVASINLQHLKEEGDWVILPRATADFAAGKFAHDGNLLYYRTDKTSVYTPVKSVEYHKDDTVTLIY